MNNAERANVYVKLSEQAFKSFDTRRRYDWMVTLGFWALMTTGLLSRTPGPPWYAWLLGAAIYNLIWLPGIWNANDNDKKLSDHYMFAAEGMALTPDYVPEPHPDMNLSKERWLGLYKHWSPWFQAIVTLFLAVLNAVQRSPVALGHWI